ncbi:MAG: hypothetical protein ACREQ9_02500, partial [Candidatus Binatia bacterium]
SPDRSWCATIVRMHEMPHAAIGGAVDKSGRDTLLNWAVYFCDFSRLMNPVPEGPAGYLTDCNVSYKRSALESVAELWREEFHETTVNWALQGRGETLFLTPKIVVDQQRSLHWGPALRERFAFGRLFAATRVAAVGRARRFGYAALSCLLPALFLLRIARNVLAKRRGIGEFIAAFPAIVALAAVWAVGETAGYVTGSAGALAPSGRRAP